VTGCKEGESSKKNAVPGHAAQTDKCTLRNGRVVSMKKSAD